MSIENNMMMAFLIPYFIYAAKVHIFFRVSWFGVLKNQKWGKVRGALCKKRREKTGLEKCGKT